MRVGARIWPTSTAPANSVLDRHAPATRAARQPRPTTRPCTRRYAHRHAEQHIAHQIHDREEPPAAGVEEHQRRPEAREVTLHLVRRRPGTRRERTSRRRRSRRTRAGGPGARARGARRPPAPGSRRELRAPPPRSGAARRPALGSGRRSCAAGRSGRILSAHSIRVTPSPSSISSMPRSCTSVRLAVR